LSGGLGEENDGMADEEGRDPSLEDFLTFGGLNLVVDVLNSSSAFRERQFCAFSSPGGLNPFC
jgi:hypothetical protein